MSDDTLSNYRVQWELQDAEQDFVNIAAQERGAEDAEGLARMYATSAVAEFPQYAGHFDGYKLGVVRSVVKTKGGVRFEAGDVVLYFDHESFLPGAGHTTAWSVRGRIDVRLPYLSVREITTNAPLKEVV